MAELTTGYVKGEMGGLIDNADDKVSTFIEDHTGVVDANGNFTKDATGTLILSASQSLTLQQLMADQSITSQMATSVLKSVKDSVMAAARNTG
ncbi:hypothetical protein [Shewanella waksmanii]|uniref:hypothetical protein n=1 Tax=Shewanella waksmanii TaxID=213783 RepID=UPI0037359CE4